MKSAVEGSGDNKGLGEKMDEDMRRVTPPPHGSSQTVQAVQLPISQWIGAKVGSGVGAGVGAGLDGAGVGGPVGAGVGACVHGSVGTGVGSAVGSTSSGGGVDSSGPRRHSPVVYCLSAAIIRNDSFEQTR